MERRHVAWVETVDERDAAGNVAAAYARVAGPDGRVENLYKAMSLTPAVIGPADDHYRALLHDPSSPLAPWLSELLATYVAILCGSRYARVNHGRNFAVCFGDHKQSERILEALTQGKLETAGLEVDALEALAFTRKLSLAPQTVCREDVERLRAAGFDDTAVSYIAQIAASFAYWARITLALGIVLDEGIEPTGSAS